MIMILWYVSSEKCVLPWELALCAICVPVCHTVCGLYGTCVALGSCVVCVSVLSVIATPSAYVVWTLALGVIPRPLSLLPSSSFPSYNMLFLSCPDQLQTFWWALWKLPGKSNECRSVHLCDIIFGGFGKINELIKVGRVHGPFWANTWATKYTSRCKPAHQICVYMQEGQTEALQGVRGRSNEWEGWSTCQMSSSYFSCCSYSDSSWIMDGLESTFADLV